MSQHSIYVAGPWADRDHVRDVAESLRLAGYKVDARWLTADDVSIDDPERSAKLKVQALNDLEDLFNSEALVYVNSLKSEGKATELGVSIALLKPIIIIGDREGNIFLNLNMPAFPTVEAAIEWMNTQGDE